MSAEKFTKEDRKLVIEELEKIQQSKFTPVNSSRKLFTDEKGMLYFLFGGKGDWHGIRQNAITELKSYSKEGAFVIAKKYKSKIDLCIGSLSTLINAENKLISAKSGDLQFHTVLTEDGMYLEEIPELDLKEI